MSVVLPCWVATRPLGIKGRVSGLWGKPFFLARSSDAQCNSRRTFADRLRRPDVVAHLFLRARYGALRKDLDDHPEPRACFDHPVLNRIVQEAEDDARRSRDANTQAIIEDAFHAELRAWLTLERFVRAATALVLIIGLLGTFYGLTVSIGRLVHLVAADAGTGDVAQALTRGLTQSLSGMAAAFSNSLVGVASAVVLSVLGVVNNVTDQRTALMVRIETYLARRLPRTAATAGDIGLLVASFADAVGRLESTVDTILIQGHTDDRGSAPFNWDLSAKRATAVLDYLFLADKTLADSYGSYFAASAYSKFRPINSSKTEEAYRQNRRIEIAVVAKDDNVRRIIDAYTRTAATPDAAVPGDP